MLRFSPVFVVATFSKSMIGGGNDPSPHTPKPRCELEYKAAFPNVVVSGPPQKRLFTVRSEFPKSIRTVPSDGAPPGPKQSSTPPTTGGGGDGDGDVARVVDPVSATHQRRARHANGILFRPTLASVLYVCALKTTVSRFPSTSTQRGARYKMTMRRRTGFKSHGARYFCASYGCS